MPEVSSWTSKSVSTLLSVVKVPLPAVSMTFSLSVSCERVLSTSMSAILLDSVVINSIVRGGKIGYE